MLQTRCNDELSDALTADFHGRIRGSLIASCASSRERTRLRAAATNDTVSSWFGILVTWAQTLTEGSPSTRGVQSRARRSVMSFTARANAASE